MQRIAPLLCTAFVFLSGLAHAHDLELTAALASPAVIVKAVYGGSEPVPFAKVQVFAPGASSEFQSARMDRRGQFSFLPEGGGDWRVMVDDEQGHRSELLVKVPDPFETGAHESGPARPARIERMLLGLSLVIGFTGFLYGFKARRRA